MVYRFPTNEKLWDAVRRDPGRVVARGTRRRARRPSSIGQHRAGDGRRGQVAWPERYNPDELSAIQHAMNLQAAGRGGVLRRVPERAACRDQEPTTTC